MYDSVWIITHHVLNKMVTESLGAETNNFKPLIHLDHYFFKYSSFLHCLYNFISWLLIWTISQCSK